MSKVAIVVDRAFGQRLSELSRLGPVWIVESPANSPVIQDLWQRASTMNKIDVTSFKDAPDLSAEAICADIIADVDEHHARWSEIEVVGVGLTPRLREAFEEIGASIFASTTGGFVCRRSREV